MVPLGSAYQSMLFKMPAHIKWIREARRKIPGKRTKFRQILFKALLYFEVLVK